MLNNSNNIVLNLSIVQAERKNTDFRLDSVEMAFMLLRYMVLFFYNVFLASYKSHRRHKILIISPRLLLICCSKSALGNRKKSSSSIEIFILTIRYLIRRFSESFIVMLINCCRVLIQSQLYFQIKISYVLCHQLKFNLNDPYISMRQRCCYFRAEFIPTFFTSYQIISTGNNCCKLVHFSYSNGKLQNIISIIPKCS